MWKHNQLDYPIPQSSSSRQAGGISIPPLRFDSPRQMRQGNKSVESSSTSVVSMDKLKFFYNERINDLKQKMVQESTIYHRHLRSSASKQNLTKSTYSKQEMLDIIIGKDIQLNQLRGQFFTSLISQQESKLNMLSTFNQSVTIIDLVQIINDLLQKVSSNSVSRTPTGKLRQITFNPNLDEKSYKYDVQFDSTIESLKSQNNVVAEKLKRIIARKKNKKGGVAKAGKQIQDQEQNVMSMKNHRFPTFTNLNEQIKDADTILLRILAEIKELKTEIFNLNGKIYNHHLSDKTLATLQRQYRKATEKVEILEHQVEGLSRQIELSRNKGGPASSNLGDAQLINAMEKILLLEKHIDNVTDNFNRETEQLQYYLDVQTHKVKQLQSQLDQRQKKIKHMSLALKHAESDKELGEFQNTVSNSVDLLMLQVERLNKELKKAQLQIDGHQLTIMRLSKIVDERQKRKSEEYDDNELARQIQKQCQQMAEENEKAIQQLDREQQVKQQKLKHIYHIAAQKSSRTNKSRQRQYESIDNNKNNVFQNDMIETLNKKIHHKIEQLKMQKERNMVLEQENADLNEEILYLRQNIERFEVSEQVQIGEFKSGHKINLIVQIITSYDIEKKIQMIDCFTLLIKILSESVKDISVINRCENLLKCAQTSLFQQGSEQHILQKSPIFEKDAPKNKKTEQQRVDSIPTLEMPKKTQGNGKDKTAKGKRKPVN